MTQDSTNAPRLVWESSQVGALVAAGRKRRAITQQQLAAKLGVSRKTLSDFECGAAKNISLATALKALSATGLTVEVRQRRTPDINEVLAQRAEQLERADRLIAAQPSSEQKKVQF